MKTVGANCAENPVFGHSELLEKSGTKFSPSTGHSGLAALRLFVFGKEQLVSRNDADLKWFLGKLVDEEGRA